VDDPYDGLSDEEWYALLGYAIDKSIATDAKKSICPLHPKHDILLQDDQNSFLLKRRYRAGVTKFGAYSLPLSGRAARAALWLEERETYRQEGHLLPMKQSLQNGRNSVFLFQCGICGKAFVSRYYLDKHMEAHHHQAHDHESEIDSAGKQSLCPADHVCKALGGLSACAETMNQVSPYYGRGALLGKEYTATASESLLPSSIYSLISKIYPTDDDDSTGSTEDIIVTTTKKQPEKSKIPKDGDFEKAFGEIRHTILRTNKQIMTAVLHQHLKNRATKTDDFVQEETSVSDLLSEAYSYEKSIFGEDLYLADPSSSCDEEEAEMLFQLCQDMMQTCFGNSVANGSENKLSIDHASNLAEDLMTNICEPIHCHHRLHMLAGHNARHVAHWNEQWEEHHSFELGWFGWIVVLGVAAFYGCVYFSGLGGANFGNNPLPSQSKKKSM